MISVAFRALLGGIMLMVGAGGGALAADLPPHWQRAYPDLNGEVQVLDQWRGQIVAVNFWATWCPPCVHEIPEFIAMQAAHPDDFQVVGIGVDSRDKLANATRTLSITYPVLVADPASNQDILLRWGNTRGVLPYTVFFDKAGVIRILHRGPLDRSTLESYYQELQTPKSGA